jgi:hypothetical protein
MRFKPQHPGRSARIDPDLPPPDRFVPGAMDLTVMTSAQRDCELITDFASEGRVLCEPQVMGI